MSNSRQYKCRFGYALVDLTVVLLAVVLLCALLAPGVQKAREAARRTQCRSNIKQLGLALHNYSEQFRSFPPGYVEAGPNNAKGKLKLSSRTAEEEFDPLTASEQVPNINGKTPTAANAKYSWITAILPNLEMRTFAEAISPDTFRAQEYLTKHSIEYLAICRSFKEMRMTLRDHRYGHAFSCPSNTNTSYDSPWQFSDGQTSLPGIESHYIGVNGSFLLSAAPPANKAAPGYGILANGVFYANSSVSFKQMTDGSSNVCMVGERVSQHKTSSGKTWNCGAGVLMMINGNTAHGEPNIMPPSGVLVRQVTTNDISLAYALGAPNHAFNPAGKPVPWTSPTNEEPAGSPTSNIESKPNLNYWPANRSTSEPNCRTGFSSPHGGGAQFLMADGACRFINESVQFDPSPAVDSVLEYLMGIADGNRVIEF